MPNSTRSNKETELLFSPDPGSLERSIRKEARSSSIDNTTCSSINFCQPPSTQTLVPSTDTRSPPSTDIFHPTSIDTEPRDMVATLILVRDDRGNLHDQEGHPCNAAVVKEAKLQEGDFEEESLMSFGGSHWCRSTPSHEHRSTEVIQNRSTSSPGNRPTTPMELTASCKAVRIMTHDESPSSIDTVIDRQQQAPIDRRAPITYRVQMPKIDVARLNALRPKPKPSENSPEAVRTPSDDGIDSMEVDKVPTGRTLTKRKEKVVKHLKRGVNEKEKESFRKRVFRIPLEKPFDEAYYTHRLWIAHQISTDTPKEELVDSSQEEWENDYYNPIMETHNMHTEEYDEDYEEERAIEQRANLDKEDRLLCHSSCKKKSPSIDRYGSTSIDTQPHQPNHLRASTDIAYFPSIDTNVDATQDGNYSIGSWADDHYLESYAVETSYCYHGADELHEEAAWGRTRFSHPIDRAIRPSIDINPSTSMDVDHTTSIDIRPKPKTTVSEKDKFDNQYLIPDEFSIFRDPDGYAKGIDGRTLHVSRENIADILQTSNGADNLFMHQRNIPEHHHKFTKEFYDTAGGIDKSFKQRFYWEENDEYGIYRDDQGYARDLDGHAIRVHSKDIRRLLERASRDEPNYICLPKHASSFTQTKLVPEIYTKDEINEMFYGVCGEQEKNKETFEMKLDSVYYPLNDSINWLTTCMEEMKQDIARIQRATDVARPTSIDRHQRASIDSILPTSIDNRKPASVDDNLPHPYSMKSQPDLHTREEIDHISALASKIEAIQGELVEIQSYIARRPEASASIDRRNNKSTDIHHRTSVDEASNLGRLVQKVTSDMPDTHNHGEEISADTYARLMRHQFILESLGDILQNIEDATTIMKDKWRRGDEAMRDFTGAWFYKRKEDMETSFPTSASSQHH
ncbi:hypothetical protein DY000_02053528 [Brassica cretica]|uniref:Uncharacterized protein n=1 Tax=Brassica cretica TaxID=69181 RepID=A0ABQ7A895_BRACR|nr:hypothetical protein DY000_02053528 [Brassica cretica]